jgi:DNA-binding transcriptional regulator YhcF (GntR family)
LAPISTGPKRSISAHRAKGIDGSRRKRRTGGAGARLSDRTGAGLGGIGRAALVEQLVQSLEAAIASGTIPVDSWLRQETLAAEFEVSRTPVREALRVLQAKGTVDVVPNRGALVRGPTSRDIREAYVLRAELEGFAAELAARWIRDDQLRGLREAEELFQHRVEAFLSETSEAEGMGWMHANDLFHRAVHEEPETRDFRTPSKISTVASHATSPGRPSAATPGSSPRTRRSTGAFASRSKSATRWRRAS